MLTKILGWLLVVELCWTVNMSFERKCQVVLAFTFRLPLIALSAFHLSYFDKYLESDEPQFAVNSSLLFQQTMILWSLISATAPNLKNFMKSFCIGMGLPVAFDISGYGSSNLYAMRSLKNKSQATSSAVGSVTATSSGLIRDDVDTEHRVRPQAWRPDQLAHRTTIINHTDDVNGNEVIASIAQWARFGDGGQKMDCWYFDPRNALRPLSSLAMKAHAWLWPSRAVDAKEEDIIERAYPFFDDIWTGKRAESWYLEALGVRPDFQGQGVGYNLVQWGIQRAREEGICASVVSAKGKDGFYTKCGFDEQYGSARQGEGNTLAEVEGANMFWKWP
ncbi:hypothetical protein BN1708_005579 [Verticillium longisporum]|uniref:N-acetyltransferase domain-containing protein n=1 Tax=Verticillium longisporum TaxID=100787 RepID=A0A0G4MBX5_VERLO|nr:hypothetical protein BN1708_005579 [Verticillium longisporum]